MYCFRQEGSHEQTLQHKLPDGLCTVAQIQSFIAEDCCLPQTFSHRLSLSVEGQDLTDEWLQTHTQTPIVLTANVSSGLNRYFAHLPGTFDLATKGSCWSTDLSPSYHRSVQQQKHNSAQSQHNSLYNEDDLKIITELLATSNADFKKDHSPPHTRTTLGPSKLFSLFTNNSVTSLLTSLIALTEKSPFADTVHAANALLSTCLRSSVENRVNDVTCVASGYLLEAFSNLTHSQYLWHLGATTVRKVRGPRELGHDALLKLVFEDADGIFGSDCAECVFKILTTKRAEDTFRNLQIILVETLGAFGHCSPLLYDKFIATHKKVVDVLECIAAGVPLPVSLSVLSPPVLLSFQPSLSILSSTTIFIDNEPFEQNKVATRSVMSNGSNEGLTVNHEDKEEEEEEEEEEEKGDDEKEKDTEKADEIEKVLRETVMRFILRKSGENRNFFNLVMTSSQSAANNFHKRIAAFTSWYSTETSPENFFAWGREITHMENMGKEEEEEEEHAAMVCIEALITAIVRHILRAAPAGESFPSLILSPTLSPAFNLQSPLERSTDSGDNKQTRNMHSHSHLTSSTSTFCPLFLDYVADFVGNRYERCVVVQTLCDALVCRSMLSHSAALREQSARVVTQITKIKGLSSNMLSRFALAATSAVTPSAEADMLVRAGCLELTVTILETHTLVAPQVKAAYYAFCTLVSCVQQNQPKTDPAEIRPGVAALIPSDEDDDGVTKDELVERISKAKERAVAEIEKIFTDEDLKQIATTNPDFLKQISDLLEDTDGAVTARFAATKTARLLSLLIPASPIYERIVVMLIRHINEFRGGKEFPLWHFDVLEIILHGLYDACHRGGAECQRMMHENNVFIVLFRLLSLDLEDEHIRFTVFEDVLKTMYGLLYDSREGHRMFQEEGYFTQLLNALNAYPSFTTPHKLAIVDRLFEILTETRAPESDGFSLTPSNRNSTSDDSNDLIENLTSTNSGFIISVPLIKHPLIAIAIVHCLALIQKNYKSGDADVAEHIVDRLKKLITGLSIPNTSALCKVNTITEILSILDAASETEEAQKSEFSTRIETSLIEIVMILGKYSMTPADLKHIIRILSYSGENDSRIPSFPYYVEALRLMAAPTLGPSVFYDFDGISSSFALPTFEKWPFAKGLTFTTWLNIQSFRRRNLQEEGAFSHLTSPKLSSTQPTQKLKHRKLGEYKPTIFSFETQEGQRVTLNVKEHHINFSVTSGPNSGTIEDCTFARTEIPKGRWFFLAFAFTPARLLTSGEGRLYINGILTERRPVRLTLRGTSAFQRNTVGCMWNEDSNRDPQVFFGQFGSVSFFDEALTNTQVQEICALGPNYLGSFQGTEWERCTLMNYSCEAMSGDYSLNNIPTSDDKGTRRAQLCGVGACRVNSFREIVVCTEGIKVLFPLILSLNQPPAATTTERCKDDAKVLGSMMDLIHSIICGSRVMEDEMLKEHGYAALARVLKSIPARFISPTLVLGFKSAYNALGHNIAMQNSLYSELLTDFFLWVFTPFSVQAELADLLKYIDTINDKKTAVHNEKLIGMKVINGNEALLNSNSANSGTGSCDIDNIYDKKKSKDEKGDAGISDGSSSSAGGSGDSSNSDTNSGGTSDDDDDSGIIHVKDKHTSISILQIMCIVRSFYWDSPNNPWYLCKDVPVSPHTGEALGARLSGSEAVKICEKLFAIITQRIEAGKLTRKDIDAVLGFISAAAATTTGGADEAQSAEIVGALLVALIRTTRSSVTRFAEMFIERGGMSVLHGLVGAQNEDLQVHAIDAIAYLSRALVGCPGRTVKVNVTAESLHQSIMKRQRMTSKTYNSLIRMAVAIPPSGSEGIMHLEYPEVLCFCILQLALTAEFDVRRQVLRDLSTLFEQGVTNVLRVFECKGWQPPFCQFIASFSKDADDEITSLSSTVVANILIASVVAAPTAGGWWNIGYFIRLLSDFGRPNVTDFYRTIRLNSAVRFVQTAQKLIASKSSIMFASVATTGSGGDVSSSDADPSFDLRSKALAAVQDEGNPLFKKTSMEAQVLVGIILAEYEFLVRTLPETTGIPTLLSQSVETLPVTATPPLEREQSQWAHKEAALLTEIISCFANLNMLTLSGWGNTYEDESTISISSPTVTPIVATTEEATVPLSGEANVTTTTNVNVGSGNAGTNLRVSGAVGVSVLAAERILQIAGRIGTDCTGEVYSALDAMTTIVDSQLNNNKGSPTPIFCFILLSTVRSALETYKNNNVAIAKEELEFVHKMLTKAHWRRTGFVIKRKSVLSKDNITLVTEMSKTSLASPSADLEAAVAALESKEWSLIAEELRPLAEEFIRSAREEENAVVAHNERVKNVALSYWKDSISENQNYISSGQDCIKTDLSRIIEDEKKRLTKAYHKFLENNADSAYYWKRILRELKSGRGPWGTEEDVATWKMDRKENHSRMRLKLKRNYAFNPHEGAAVQNKHTSLTRVSAHNPNMSMLTSTTSGMMQSLISTNLSWLEKYDIKSSIFRDTGATEDESGDNADGEGTGSLTNTLNGTTLPLPLETTGGSSNPGATGTSTPKKKTKRKKAIYEAACSVIKAGNILEGVFSVRFQSLTFKENRGDLPRERYHDFTWDVNTILGVQKRRYMLIQTALEIFFLDKTNCFISFADVKTQREVYSKIVNTVKPPNLRDSDSHSPAEILRKRGITQRWQRREISNFDYLMELNTIAGRTYNDLRQYPVFPWILTDYESESLDLNDPGIYRDLSKPMGALNPKRLKVFRERLNVLVESGSQPFLYGSHYSSADVVFFYMIRVEPITSYFLRLQSRFDYPDRMFHSVASAWNSVYNYSSDVKELIPEFFYYPDFLRNSNGFNFGERQTGEPLGDVVLPPWAHGSPEEFVRINREALESEYVSAHLHEWIDLIFGYKQRGDAALKADNLFCYVSYEGAVDLNKIDSEAERLSIKDQIANFGQTPSQLLTKPHPPRGPAKAPILRSIFPRPSSIMGVGSAAAAAAVATSQAFPSLRLWPTRFGKTPVTFVSIAGGNASTKLIVTVTEARVVQVSRFIERRAQEADTDRAKTSAPGSPSSSTSVPVMSPPSPSSSSSSSSSSLSSSLLSSTSGTSPTMALTSPLFMTTTTNASRGSAPIIDEGFVRKRSGSRNIAPQPATVGSAGSTYSLSAGTAGNGAAAASGGGGCAAYPFSFEYGATDGKPIGTYFAQRIKPNPNLFAVGGPGNEYIFSCGYWDNSFRVSLAATGAQTQRIVRHRSPVTCVRYCAEKGVLATGSRDTTVIVWKFAPGEVGGVIDEPIHTLYGHDDEVTSLDICVELDVVVSGSRAGHIIAHTLRGGRFTWSTKLAGTISLIRIAPCAGVPGAIVAYSKERHTLYLHSINGRLLAKAEVHDSLNDLVITRDGKHLVTAGKNTIEFWDLFSLRSLHRYLVPSPVTTLDIDSDGTFLAAGLNDGCIAFIMRNDATPSVPSGRPLNAIRMTFSKLTKSNHSSTMPSPASATPQQQPQQKHSSLSSIEYI